MIAALLAFAVKNWRVLVPIAGVIVLVFAAWRIVDNAHDRGHDEGYAKANTEQKAAYDAALAIQLRQQRESDAAAYRIGLAEVAAQRIIQTNTQTIVQRIPASVTVEADRACPVPLGFVRSYDAAASGDPAAGFALRSPEPDAAPSGVVLSEIAGVSASAFGDCHANAEQLRALQKVVSEFQARQVSGDDRRSE